MYERRVHREKEKEKEKEKERDEVGRENVR
jgi:hypothetical protein